MWHHTTEIMVHPISVVFKLRNAIVPLMMLMALCNSDASASGITLSKDMLHLNLIVLTNKCSGAIDNTLSVSHDVKPGANGDTWHCQRNVLVLLMVLPTIHDVDTNAVASYDTQHQCQCKHVMPIFMAITLHDKEKSCCTSFQFS